MRLQICAGSGTDSDITKIVVDSDELVKFGIDLQWRSKSFTFCSDIAAGWRKWSSCL